MVTIEDFSRLTSAIYGAAVVPQQWDAAVKEMHRTFDRAGGAVASVTMSRAEEVGRSIIGTTLSAEAPRQYDEYYSRIDHVLQALEDGPVGTVRTGAELILPYANSEFYCDWIRPNGVKDGLFVRLTDGPRPTSLLVVTSAQFDRERERLMSELIPHVQQALRTRSHLATLTQRKRDFAEATEAVGHGIVILAAGSRVVHLNSAAERILTAGDGLGIDSGCVTAVNVDANRELQRLVHRALTADETGIREGGSGTCARPSGQRPYVIHVLPLQTSRTGRSSGASTAMLLVIDPGQSREPPASLLRRAYGLTRAEAEVALLVLRGEGLKPIADALCVSPATVRTHLRQVFDKTDTHRQAELVRLLMTITP